MSKFIRERTMKEATKEAIAQDLGRPNLSSRCLHGGTQNPSESLFGVIRTRLPNNVFVPLMVLEFRVYEAISTYNVGEITKFLMFKELGLQSGENCITRMKIQRPA